MDFIVVDTEGTRELREIAIANSAGELVYEAFNQEYPEHTSRAISTSSKPLKIILLDFMAIARSKLLVFHHAVE